MSTTRTYRRRIWGVADDALSGSPIEGRMRDRAVDHGQRSGPVPPNPTETPPTDDPAAAPPAAAHRGSPRRYPGQQGEPEDFADVRLPDPLACRQVRDRCIHAVIEHPPPPERPRQRLDHGVVYPRSRRPIGAVRGDDEPPCTRGRTHMRPNW